LIPQLILSGVVVRFDKLNPIIGNTATVPMVGDIMASRWAFEASMVAQYKDNEFERKFYPYDKIKAHSDYKRIYFIPALETKLDFIKLNYQTTVPEIREKVVSDLQTLQHELSEELGYVGKKDFLDINSFVIDRFNEELYQKSKSFFEILRKFYVNRYNKADSEKERIINSLTDTREKEEAFEKFKNQYQNEAIADLVKNTNEMHRIIEKDGKLVQKIYPIYKDPDPAHSVDFDAQFYMPSKHFLNRNVDTLYFNMGVIWSMTFVLMIALYFEVLRKVIDGLGNISNPIPKRM
jgi:hypothetical protein